MLRSVYFRSVPVGRNRLWKKPSLGDKLLTLILSADHRVDLGDITARKLHHGCIPIVGFVGVDKDRSAGCFSLGEGVRKVSDLASGYLSSIWIRQMAIGDERRHLAKFRLHPNSAISIDRTPDFDAG